MNFSENHFADVLTTLFFIALKMSDFIPKKGICRKFYCITLFKRNLLLKRTKFLLRLTVTMLCRKQHAEIGWDASKIKKNPDAPKKFQDEKLVELLHEDSYQVQAVLAESLGVDHTAVSKRLKALGMIKKKGRWVPYELKPKDIERRLVTLTAASMVEKERVFESYRGQWWQVDTLR